MKRNQKPQAAKIKSKRREKLIELEGIGEARTCPSYALNYVAFKMLCFRFKWDFLSRFVPCLPSGIYIEGLSGRLRWQFIKRTALV